MTLLRSTFALVLSVAALAVQAAPTPNHVYLLDGTLADQNGGPSLASDGGTLDATGHSFGANQGLSLSNVLGRSTRSISSRRSVPSAATGNRSISRTARRTRGSTS